MTSNELSNIIKGGESSKIQFKERLPHADSMAHELIAFSNSKGGIIIFGVNDKTGDINDLLFGIVRNNQMALFASKTLPYSGLGSGMRRSFTEQPDIELYNDVEGEQFIVRFPRKED